MRAIKEGLNFIRNEFFEVPFITYYRPEHVQDFDVNRSPNDHHINKEIVKNDLWKVYHMDEKVKELISEEC